jgi:hypothetical protein
MHVPIVGQVGNQYAHQRTTSAAGINRILGEGCENHRCPCSWLANGPLPDPRSVKHLGRGRHQSRRLTPQDTAYGPVLSGGMTTPSCDTPAHGPLGRPEESLLRVLGTAVALTRPTSAIRRLRPVQGC